MPGSGNAAADGTSGLRETARPGHSHWSVSVRSAERDRSVRVSIRPDSDRAEVSSRAHRGRSAAGEWSPSATTGPDDAGTVRARVQLYPAGEPAFADARSGEVFRHAATGT